MKKTFVALAALAVVGAASAQSTVTIYGRLDAGYSATTTTTTTTAGVDSDARNNGINNNGLATSYWGMRGSEDLGGGLRANFNLETSVGIDSGVTGTTTGANQTTAAGGFDRISTLGISGNFGSVMVGKFYTPMFLTILASDVFGAGGAYTVNLFTDGIRASDAFFYTTPNMSGFSATIMVGRNDVGTTAADSTTANTGLSATYAAGPLMVSVAMGKVENKTPAQAAYAAYGTTAAFAGSAAASGQNDGTALTGTYDFGAAKLFAGYIRGKTQADTTISTFTESTETNLGVSVPFGAATFMLAYGRNTKDVTTAGVMVGQTGTDVVAGVTYDLSKRTALYFKTGRVGALDNTTALAGTKTSITALGLRHLF